MGSLQSFLAKRKRARAKLRRDLIAGRARVHRVASVDRGVFRGTALTRCGLWLLDADRRITSGATSHAPRCANCWRSERASP